MKEDRERKWQQFISLAPEAPGVYIFKDLKSRPIYIGKASNLKDRIKAYASGGDGRFLSSRIYLEAEEVEFIITADSAEALFLEDRLIKEKKPRYNVKLKDDKSYLCLVLDKSSKWPRLMALRRPDVKKRVVFGPFPSASGTRKMLSYLQYVFPLRTCSDEVMKRHKHRPCVEYEMGRCLGPCAGLVSHEDYMKVVEGVEKSLKSGFSDFEEMLERKMWEKAEREEFEQAAAIRDVLFALRDMNTGLGISRGDSEMFDAIAFVSEADFAAVAVLSYRAGVMTQAYRQVLPMQGLPAEEVFVDFIRTYYSSGRLVPPRIFTNIHIPQEETLESFLSHLRQGKVEIKTPRVKKYAQIVRSAEDNARLALEVKHHEILWNGEAMAAFLKLPAPVSRMEGFDISRYGPVLVVGSCVVMIDGELRHDLYRRYRIFQEIPDDYAAMREVIERRLKRGIREETLPDLILIDGGKGHLRVAWQCVKALGLEGKVHVAAISKSRGVKEGDSIHLVDGTTIRLSGLENPQARFLVLLRNEAHRFALSYLRRLDARLKSTSVLTSIPGIGVELARAIISQVGSVNRLKKMSLQELCKLRGIGDKTAKKIYSYFHGEGGH